MQRLAVLISAVVFVASSCSSETSDKTAPKSAPQETPAKPASASADKPAAATFAVTDLLTPYEACRALLAGDTAAGVSDCAGTLAKAATAQKLPELAKAAEALSSAPADDLEAVRLAFGAVSEHFLAALKAHPDAAKDVHVFECTMTKGYGRWAQLDAKLANPYQGAKMLDCGAEVANN